MAKGPSGDGAGESFVTFTLARWAAELTVDEIPEDVRSYARTLVADHLRSVALGASTPWSAAIARVARARGSSGPCPIGDLGPGADSATAAFVNGCFAHGADLDDTHVGAMLHPGATVIPPVLALAHEHGSSGASILEAVVAGYEAAIRIALAIQPEHYERGFQATGTCGALGAAVAAGALLGHTPSQVESAMGLAGSMAAGLARFYYAGGDAKRIHAGRAAEAGVLAAQMVNEGLTGPGQVLEGRAGFGDAYSAVFEEEKIRRDLGTQYRLLDVIIKVHATSARLQAIVEAAGEAAVSRTVIPDQSVRIEAHLPQLMRDRLTHRNPTDVTSAQMSLPFTVALTIWLAAGSEKRPVLTVQDYEKHLENRAVRRLAESFSISYRDGIPRSSADAVTLSFMTSGGTPVVISSEPELSKPKDKIWSDVAGRLVALAPTHEADIHQLVGRIRNLEHDDSAHDIPAELGRILSNA